MRGKKRENMCETQAACTLAMLLMNFLLLSIIGTVAWLLHFALAENNELNTFLRGGFLQ